MLYRVDRACAWFELTTLMVIDIDCIGSYNPTNIQSRPRRPLTPMVYTEWKHHSFYIIDKRYSGLDCGWHGSKQGLLNLRVRQCRAPVFSWYSCCSYFRFLYCICFVYLRSVSCANCFLTLWVVHSRLSIRFYIELFFFIENTMQLEGEFWLSTLFRWD